MDKFRIDKLDDFIGQPKVIDRLVTHINAALAERRPLEHILLAGQPGFGKTVLTQIIGNLLDDPVETLVCPVSDKALQGMVASHDGILVLDEIHALSKKEKEALLPLLEFGYLQTRSGARIEAGWLTIIGATTEPENIIPPLRDRFKIKPVFEDYSDEDMGKICRRMADREGFSLSEEDSIVLGRAAGGTPRNCADLILAGKALRLREQREVSALEVLKFCDVDETGLTRDHFRYLEILQKFGGTRGIKQIATALRESEAVCMDIERLLFKQGLINFGTTGRELTRAGYTKVKARSA